MKTTLELPDELMRDVKVRAAREGRKLKDVVSELLRRGLDQAPQAHSASAPARVDLPLVHCTRPARPDQEMTPERVAAILADEEADRASGGGSAAV